MHITFVVGARPNFMKVAPILKAAKQAKIESLLLHTGQHYDQKMSTLFFDQLGLPRPDVYLGVGSGSHAVQTAKVMTAFDEVLNNLSTDVVLVVGDVNSTLACALVAVKRNIRVAHVEAGLRSGDRTMPEEINRIVTDQISDFLFTTERTADENLVREGIPKGRIFFVGNVMIDSLLEHRARASETKMVEALGLTKGGYAVCTLHRPSNVDTRDAAENTVRALEILLEQMPVILPIHPRTNAKLSEFGLIDRITQSPNLKMVEPLGYLEFMCLMDNARVVFTDSGGIQEETTVLGTPCLTFRENTERPITITEGTNQLIGLDPSRLSEALDRLSREEQKATKPPEYWDGHASERIVDILLSHA
jgi:UDP-N-acetylglucosamine 2-epimerase (non-hydrolysing)